MKETKNLEFKSTITNTFLKTVSAYSNFGTGIIEFGRDDDGTIIGIDDPVKVSLDIENKINDSIRPKPDYDIKINNNNGLVTLTVYEGKYKPYLYKGKAYRRSDSSTVEVDQIELKRLTLEGSNLSFEGLPCDNKDLSFKYLEEKLIERLNIKKLSGDILKTLGFYNDGKYNNAAAIFSDVNEFPGIDYARFGNNINEIVDRNTIYNCSILKQYDEIISVFKRYYQYEEINGFERKDRELIPEEAFREAVANSLVHRTWDVQSHVKISMYDDRIEITSPGGLPRELNEKEYLNGNISYLRNPIIGQLFFRLKYIEMFGTGILRIKECYKNNTRKPHFEVFDNSISITLPVISSSYEVTTDGKTLLDAMEVSLQLSSSEISERVGWSKDKTIRVINQLKSLGYIKTIGNGRGTRYIKVQ